MIFSLMPKYAVITKITVAEISFTVIYLMPALKHLPVNSYAEPMSAVLDPLSLEFLSVLVIIPIFTDLNPAVNLFIFRIMYFMLVF